LSTYRTLLSIVVGHNYNSSGVCPSLNFYPTERSIALFAKAGLLLRQTRNGIQIVYDEASIDALEMYALDPLEPLSFDFKVFSSDPDFRNYTEPFTGIEDDILYFDNRAVSGTGTQAISASEFVCADDFRPADSNELVEILDPKDRLINPEFVLRIYATNNKGSLLKQWLQQPPTIYSIRFNSRQRYWKYYLLGKIAMNNKSKDGFSIVDPENQFEFETTGEEMLADQSVAYTFRSKHKIPLYEHYPFRFQLRQKGQGGDTTVIPSLPYASVGQAGLEAIAGKKVIVSEIYINS
jgi:hypothetical protein